MCAVYLWIILLRCLVFVHGSVCMCEASVHVGARIKWRKMWIFIYMSKAEAQKVSPVLYFNVGLITAGLCTQGHAYLMFSFWLQHLQKKKKMDNIFTSDTKLSANVILFRALTITVVGSNKHQWAFLCKSNWWITIISVLFSLFIHYSSFLFVEVWKEMASSLSQHGDTMSVGDEGLPAWGQAFPDGNIVQLDQA